MIEIEKKRKETPPSMKRRIEGNKAGSYQFLDRPLDTITPRPLRYIVNKED